MLLLIRFNKSDPTKHWFVHKNLHQQVRRQSYELVHKDLFSATLFNCLFGLLEWCTMLTLHSSVFNFLSATDLSVLFHSMPKRNPTLLE